MALLEVRVTHTFDHQSQRNNRPRPQPNITIHITITGVRVSTANPARFSVDGVWPRVELAAPLSFLLSLGHGASPRVRSSTCSLVQKDAGSVIRRESEVPRVRHGIS
jgi:hypothetical protein